MSLTEEYYLHRDNLMIGINDTLDKLSLIAKKNLLQYLKWEISKKIIKLDKFNEEIKNV